MIPKVTGSVQTLRSQGCAEVHHGGSLLQDVLLDGDVNDMLEDVGPVAFGHKSLDALQGWAANYSSSGDGDK